MRADRGRRDREFGYGNDSGQSGPLAPRAPHGDQSVQDRDEFVGSALLTPDPRIESRQRFGADGVPAGRVDEELGLSENAVILAKSRVLKRLREEVGGLLW